MVCFGIGFIFHQFFHYKRYIDDSDQHVPSRPSHTLSTGQVQQPDSSVSLSNRFQFQRSKNSKNRKQNKKDQKMDPKAKRLEMSEVNDFSFVGGVADLSCPPPTSASTSTPFPGSSASTSSRLGTPGSTGASEGSFSSWSDDHHPRHRAFQQHQQHQHRQQRPSREGLYRTLRFSSASNLFQAPNIHSSYDGDDEEIGPKRHRKGKGKARALPIKNRPAKEKFCDYDCRSRVTATTASGGSGTSSGGGPRIAIPKGTIFRRSPSLTKSFQPDKDHHQSLANQEGELPLFFFFLLLRLPLLYVLALDLFSLFSFSGWMWV